MMDMPDKSPRQRAGFRRASRLDISFSRIIFDRNSQVRFHNPMITGGLEKPPAHGVVHGQLHINS
jgi:hypothetical protein